MRKEMIYNVQNRERGKSLENQNSIVWGYDTQIKKSWWTGDDTKGTDEDEKITSNHDMELSQQWLFSFRRIYNSYNEKKILI